MGYPPFEELLSLMSRGIKHGKSRLLIIRAGAQINPVWAGLSLGGGWFQIITQKKTRGWFTLEKRKQHRRGILIAFITTEDFGLAHLAWQ